MSNDQNKPTDPMPPFGEAPQQPGPIAEAVADAAPEPDAAKPLHTDDLIASLRIEIADLKEKILRAYAEVDNARKAADKDIDRIRHNAEDDIRKASRLGIARLATDIVGVSDNFKRAIGAVPAGAADLDPALKSLLDGVTLTERELLNVLERHGIKLIDPMGEPFNPHFHQAMTQMQRPEVPAGTVVQVFQVGYTLEGRNLRSAVVAVATGGARPVKEAGADASAPNAAGGANGAGTEPPVEPDPGAPGSA